MSGCGLCGKVRAHLPAPIRARLAVVEARIRAKKIAKSLKTEYTAGGAVISTPLALTPKESAAIVASYTTTTQGRAASPPQLPTIPSGGDGAEAAK
jgi:hypothetical protein